MSAKNTASSIHTIDEKHSDFLDEFKKDETELLPQLEKEKDELKEYIRSLKDNQVEEYMETRDKIHLLRDKIKNIKTNRKKYFLDNSKYIFDYFEQKKSISTREQTNQHSRAIHNFFKIKSTSEESSNIQSNKYSQSKQYYQSYWRNVNSEATINQDITIESDLCESCMEGEMIPQDEEGILICNNPDCAKFITYIVDSSKPNNKDPPNEVSYTAYIRLNHFKEILSQFQAKETTQIPEEVIDAIKARIKKERIHDISTINYNKMRDILRKLGLNKYFEHIQYINSLFGNKTSSHE